MLYNLKHAIRNLRRNGFYSVINMTGLAVSLAACILIMLWVWDELSYDKFHCNADRIYSVNTHIVPAAWRSWGATALHLGLSRSIIGRAEVRAITLTPISPNRLLDEVFLIHVYRICLFSC